MRPGKVGWARTPGKQARTRNKRPDYRKRRDSGIPFAVASVEGGTQVDAVAGAAAKDVVSGDNSVEAAGDMENAVAEELAEEQPVEEPDIVPERVARILCMGIGKS